MRGGAYVLPRIPHRQINGRLANASAAAGFFKNHAARGAVFFAKNQLTYVNLFDAKAKTGYNKGKFGGGKAAEPSLWQEWGAFLPKKRRSPTNLKKCFRKRGKSVTEMQGMQKPIRFNNLPI